MSLSRQLLRGNRFSVFTTGGECEVSIFDVTGRKVTKLEVEQGKFGATVETPIQCNNWSAGVYFVRAVHDESAIRTAKVVLLK
ncbi:T9SS type A sorting domain-containing protein [candidate division WOR-3 bacterium]|nr:T9SS type A sorting domain-containing protein [candidate division WOR-3 bacterium]